MSWRHHAILFVMGLLMALTVAHYQSVPGYMDADYYFGGGIQLATGRGFTEPYIWNYLGDPSSLPTPSHTYWMPLASIVAAFGMWLTGQTTYAAGRLPFVLLSACVPLLTATLAWEFSRNELIAFTAGLLSIFSQYYAPFMPVPDNYAIYMLLGSSFFLLVPRPQKWIPFALGMLVGLMTLARSDGLLWLGLAGLAILWKPSISNPFEGKSLYQTWLSNIIPPGLLVLLGYLVIMGWWHFRSLTLLHSFLTPGGGRVLWLLNYRETFIYPASILTLEHLLHAGWGAIIQDRLVALGSNLLTAIFAQGGILLLPFICIGLWQMSTDLRIKLGLVGWLITYFVLSVVFPFAGARGSFHHAGAALQPIFWAAAPIGMNTILEWLRRRGQFKDVIAPYIFHGLLILWVIVLTGFLVNIRVLELGWSQDDRIYPSVEAKLQENGISPTDVVIVPNPPGYYVRTGRSAVRLPTGDEVTVLEVARKFHANYLVLEKSNDLGDLQDLYDHPGPDPAFEYLGEADGAHLYRVGR